MFIAAASWFPLFMYTRSGCTTLKATSTTLKCKKLCTQDQGYNSQGNQYNATMYKILLYTRSRCTTLKATSAYNAKM